MAAVRQEVRFRAHAGNQEGLRRLERAHAPGKRLLTAVMWIGAAVLAGLSARPPAVLVGGRPVVATRVLVVRDESGSMGAFLPALEAQIREMRLGGIRAEEEELVSGVGVSRTGTGNLLEALERGLTGSPEADAVYVFSDFVTEMEGEVLRADWRSDDEGYAHLASLLRQHGARLYLCSVDRPPPRELVRIALVSGGGEIPSGDGG